MPLRNVQTANATPIYLNTFNRTGTHLSTNIFIAVEGRPVAAVKSLQVTEQRQIAKISEVGTDGLIDSAPQSSTQYTIQCSRTRFDGKRIAEGFYRGFVHVASQRVPFNIEIYDLIEGDGNNRVITVIENCWINNISYSYEADNFVIVDNMNLDAESISSTRNETGGSAISDPSRVISFNPFEVQADIGTYRGAVDAAGLINAFDGTGGRLL